MIVITFIIINNSNSNSNSNRNGNSNSNSSNNKHNNTLWPRPGRQGSAVVTRARVHPNKLYNVVCMCIFSFFDPEGLPYKFLVFAPEVDR